MDILDTREAGPRVIRGSLMRLGAQVLGALAMVASSAIVIRHLGVVDTGRFVTVTALVVIVASLSDLGLSAIGVREYAVIPRDAGHSYLRNLLGIRLTVMIAGLAIAVAFAAVAGYPDVMILGTAIAGLGMLLIVTQQSIAIPLQVRLRFGWVAVLALLLQVGVAVEAALLAVAGAALLPFFALQLPVMIPILALTVWAGGRESRMLPALDIRKWRRMMGPILIYSAAVVFSVLYFRISQVMVSLLASGEETGYFGVSFRVLESLTLIPPLLVSSALPVLSRAARDDAGRFAYAGRRLVETMIVAGIGTAVIVFLGAELAVRIVAGNGFGPSVEVLQILSLALIGTFVIAARGYALLSLGRLRQIMIANAIAFATVIGAGIPLTLIDGARGAAIALTAAELTLAAGYEVALTRGAPELRPSGGFLARVLVAATLAVAPAVAITLPYSAALVLGAAIYLAALFALRALPVELRHALRPSRAPAAEGS